METNVKKKITIKQIFTDHWEEFTKHKLHKIPRDMIDSVIESVDKMLNCGDPQYAYAEYMCLSCGEHRKIIGFSCKSRFYNRCGKVYIDSL